MRSPFCRWKSRTQPTRSAGLAVLDAAVADAGCQRGRPLKSRTFSQTLATGASITELRHRHAPSLLVPPAFFGAFALGPASLPRDALHVGGLADQPALLGQAPRPRCRYRQQAVDQRRLHAVAQGGVDHLVGRAAVARRPRPAHPVELHDADVLDLLQRLDAGGDDPLDMLQHLAAEQRMARLVGEDVLGLVDAASAPRPRPRRAACAASAMWRASSAAFSAISTSTDLRRAAASVSRTVLTFSSASAARARAASASARAADSSSDFW
jgi:hypothetical protein